MSQPPIVPGRPRPLQLLQQQPARTGSRTPWIVGGALTLCAVAVLTVLSLNRPNVDTGTPTTATNPVAVAETPKIVTTPAKSSIQLAPKITRKKCFGSAGCSIDFHVDMAYGGQPLSDDDTWVVTYEIRGVEDGPGVGSLEINGKHFSSETESVSTARASDEISLAVTDVELR